MMHKDKKKTYVEEMKSFFKKTSSVFVTHYEGLTVKQIDELRSEMRNNGAKFKVTKNRLTKLALEQTKFKDLIDLFTGPTAIAYSDDPVAPAKVSSNFEKKLENFKIIGGGYDGDKIDIEKFNFLATLPSMDELRGKILGLISAPAQKITSIIKEPSGQLARLVSAHGENMDKSN